MRARDILTIIGTVCLAAGPVLMHHIPDSTAYTIGEILIAVGPVLMGSRAMMSGSSPTTPEQPPK